MRRIILFIWCIWSVLPLMAVQHSALDTITMPTDTLCGNDEYRFVHHTFEFDNDTISSAVLEHFDMRICQLRQREILLIPHQVETHIYDTLCYGETYIWDEYQYTISGVYTDTLTNTYGCDSIVTLNLTVNKNYEVPYMMTACDSYTWSNGVTYTQSGVYYDSLTTIHGCDSIEVLNLTIHNSVEVPYTVTACDAYTWSNGVTYTQSGVYYDSLTTIHGCDSIEVLTLTISPPAKSEKMDTAICYGESYLWREETYNTTGVYMDTVTNGYGCDSIIYTLQLTVLPQVETMEITDTILGGQHEWQGEVYTQSGDYSVTLIGQNGCDSVVVLHLVEIPTFIDTAWTSIQCAGNGVWYLYMQAEGLIEKVAIECSEQAQAAGLQGVEMDIQADGVYELTYTNMRAGRFPIEIVGTFRDIETARYGTRVTFMYPNTIFEQNHNDLIAILNTNYNGGYHFTAFQWYKDNELIPGETHSYLHQALDFDAEYTVMLTDTNNVQIMSCPFTPTQKATMAVYPTNVRSGEEIRCHVNVPASICLYDAYGQLLHENKLSIGETKVQMPYVSGVYILQLITDNQQYKQVKVIVQ